MLSANSKKKLVLYFLPSLRYNLAYYHIGHPGVVEPEAHWACTVYRTKHINTKVSNEICVYGR